LVLYGARVRLADPNALTALGIVFESRTPPDHGLLAWEAFLASDGAAAFREHARRYVFGRASSRAWRVLVGSKQPLLEASRLYLNQATPFAAWASQQEIQLEKPTVLVRQLQRLLLEPATLREVVAREGTTCIEAWIDGCFVESERVLCFRRYLVEIPAKGWPRDDQVIRRILDRFDLPGRARPFWDGFPVAIINAVNNWLKDRSLTDLLGEGDRVQFWREFLPWIVSCESSKGEEAVFIRFKEWFAVQFKVMGRATYMLDRTHWTSLRRLDASSLYTGILAKRSIGRYEHRGYYWQESARLEVLRVMRGEGDT